MGEPSPIPSAVPPTSCHVWHLRSVLDSTRNLPTDSWAMTSMCLYVVTSDFMVITPAGWSVLQEGNQEGNFWKLMKIDGTRAPGSISMTLNWPGTATYIEGVLFRWFGGDGGGTWSHIVGPSYSLPLFSEGYAEWTSPGGAVRHCQVMHATNTYTGYDEIPDAGGPVLGCGHHEGSGGYSGTAYTNWQNNPASGPITWNTIGAYGGPKSSSFAFVWYG